VSHRSLGARSRLVIRLAIAEGLEQIGDSFDRLIRIFPT
jgi:hypothetical protein